MRTTTVVLLTLVFVLSACGTQATAEPAVPTITVAVPTETSVPVPTEMPIPTETPVYTEGVSSGGLSTDWYVCAFIDSGEGAYQALDSVDGTTPHDMGGVIGQQIEIVHVGDPNSEIDDWLEVFDWASFNSEQPMVWVGDFVCDTVRPYMQQYFQLLPENDHRGEHSH